MQPSECCIFRMIIASVIGSVVTLLLVCRFDPWALALIPLGGSLATVFVIALFQGIGLAMTARANAAAPT
ncbi:MULTISPECIES: hypothetical protein [unclassified Methylobacterium]|uniref:hypothetical protein n=1 Tax=unclassified Methylobacterium TaxID=2615210 RepID=UPI0011C1FB1E|nr:MULTISPECIES: hypothetical protein [unclassified Methylobacterium]QEE39428.1 hypothetical protein FVA80_11245 [Methylobacterium sp. WL1]TXN03012.1 hypothetical protein FV242_12700 [Methylobacterium sp. WL64]TXN57000.1 hypothetical protein FV241_13095 [Methylobacterium sp. WL2]